MDGNSWDSDSTRNLLERIHDQETAALDELLARDRDLIRGIIALRYDAEMRARLEISDIVQEAQLQIARRMPDYLQRRPMPYHLWVRRTTLETMLQLRRHHFAQRRQPQTGRVLPHHSSLLIVEQLIDPGPGPLQRLLEQEAREQVQQAVSRLSATDQEVLLLRTVEHLTNDEAAQVLGLNPGTASRRFGRALLNLRDQVNRLLPPDATA
ncbi:MAG: sigma-70 family RNA polymerase sigma factor [Gemmataceae bacterium]